MTRIFYLVMASLTLTAAAAQWLPHEGLSSTDLNFVGLERARAQSPSPFPSTSAASASFPTTASPAAAQPGGYSQPPVYAQPPAQSTIQSIAQSPIAPVAPVASSPYQTQATSYVAPGAATAPAIAGPAFGAAPAASMSSVLAPSADTTGLQFPTQELEGTKVLARVGGDVIFAGEVLCSVNSYLARNGVDFKDPEVIQQREQLVKMRLQQLIDTRIIVNEAKRKIPEAGFAKAMEKFDEEFDKTVVPQMLSDRKASDLQQLEAMLRRDGTTLEREKKAFAESVLRSSWISQNVKVTQEVTHEQMLAYYQSHLAEFEFTGASRWEQISMKFENFPTKQAAYAEAAKAGNLVVDGRPFEQVAKTMSQGSTAAQGGEVNWTKRGSLVSQPLDTAVFTLPIGTLSPIIEDERGFHIVRVIDRRDAGRKPFTEVQGEIRKKITEERTVVAKVKYVEEIKKKTTVWTVFDDEKPKGIAGAGGASAAESARYPTPTIR
ncbi:MAG: peptidyl-prolyl cis-trans isomerase [Planctomycetia bacterium]|nr:peptidyl-prolyl cis-trans isomerase [Planctomycetia bacterium]